MYKRQVQPNTGLGAGDYSETLTISGSDGTSANVQLSFAVTETAPVTYTLTVELDVYKRQLYYYPVYRYTYRGETYEQIGNVPAMEEQARKKVGTELTLFIDPAKPTSFYCLEEEKGYFQQRLAYLIVALLVIAVLIMIGVMWLTI